MCSVFLVTATVGLVIVLDGHKLRALDMERVLRADVPYQMAAYMYNVWSLAYRTHSLVFVRHRFNLLDFLFSNKDRFLRIFYYGLVTYNSY